MKHTFVWTACIAALVSMQNIAQAQGSYQQRAPVHDSVGSTPIKDIPRRYGNPTDPTTGTSTTTIYQGGAESWTKAFGGKTYLVSGALRNGRPIPDYSASKGNPLFALIAGVPIVQNYPLAMTGCDGHYVANATDYIAYPAVLLHFTPQGQVYSFEVSKYSDGSPLDAKLVGAAPAPYLANQISLGVAPSIFNRQYSYRVDAQTLVPVEYWLSYARPANPETIAVQFRPAPIADHLGRPLFFSCPMIQPLQVKPCEDYPADQQRPGSWPAYCDRGEGSAGM